MDRGGRETDGRENVLGLGVGEVGEDLVLGPAGPELAALRDHERSSFEGTAPATAPVEWFRALRDITSLFRAWTGELACGASRYSSPAALRPVRDDEWRTCQLTA